MISLADVGHIMWGVPEGDFVVRNSTHFSVKIRKIVINETANPHGVGIILKTGLVKKEILQTMATIGNLDMFNLNEIDPYYLGEISNT